MHIAHAAGFVVKDITIEGLQRVEPGTVFVALPVRVGDFFDISRTSEVINAVYDLKLFDNITLKHSEDKLIISVVERPGIEDIIITGNEALPTEGMVEGLKSIGITKGQVYDRTVFERLRRELKQQYYALGKYAIHLTLKADKLPNNRVNLLIDIDEGETTKIRKIQIIGNRRIDDDTLTKDFQSGMKSWYDFFSDKDHYSKIRLEADLESMKNIYFDHGYLDFTTKDVRVTLTPDKRYIDIVIKVSEGEVYRISNVAISDPKKVEGIAKLKKQIPIKKGQIFSRRKVIEATNIITDHLKDDGYAFAFAKVNTVPQKDQADPTIELIFIVEPGKRIYVRRIRFTGAKTTDDEVFRHELRQLEAAPYSQKKIVLSRKRLQRLPYVASVAVKELPVEEDNIIMNESGVCPVHCFNASATSAAAKGCTIQALCSAIINASKISHGPQKSTNQIDLDFDVDERLSGSFNIGAGYSNNEGAVVNLNLNQDNFLGSGNRVRFAFSNSSVNERYGISLFDPHFTIDGISRSWQVNYTSTDVTERNTAGSNSDEFSVGMSFGIPVSEEDTLGLGARLQYIHIDRTAEGTRVRDFIAREGNNFANLVTHLSLAYDTRDRSLFTTSGIRLRSSFEFFVPGSDLTYFKFDYAQKTYIPLDDEKKWILVPAGNISYARAFGGTSEVPFYDRFYAGGTNSVRGYQSNTLGPKERLPQPPPHDIICGELTCDLAPPSYIDGRSIGGNFRLVSNLNLFFPVDSFYDPTKLRAGLFADFGNVFDEVSDFSWSDLRASTGLQIQWLTAIGAISVNFATPLKDKSGDSTEKFQLDFGANF